MEAARKAEKEFDAVEFMRTQRKRLSEDLKDKSAWEVDKLLQSRRKNELVDKFNKSQRGQSA